MSRIWIPVNREAAWRGVEIQQYDSVSG